MTRRTIAIAVLLIITGANAVRAYAPRDLDGVPSPRLEACSASGVKCMATYSRWQGGPSHLLEHAYYNEAMTLLAAREATARRDSAECIFLD